MVKPIGEYLVEAGLLEQSQVEAALAEQRRTGRKLGEIIVEHGWLQAQTIEYWMKNVIIPHRRITYPPQPASPTSQPQVFPNKPPLPRVKPPEATLVIGVEQISIPPQTAPSPPPTPKKDIQHQETLILERKDLPPLG
ncbi:MAG: hypothetical protein Q6J18_07315 [Gloeomargarita sp. DG02_3_bins_56]